MVIAEIAEKSSFHFKSALRQWPFCPRPFNVKLLYIINIKFANDTSKLPARQLNALVSSAFMEIPFPLSYIPLTPRLSPSASALSFFIATLQL